MISNEIIEHRFNSRHSRNGDGGGVDDFSKTQNGSRK